MDKPTKKAEEVLKEARGYMVLSIVFCIISITCAAIAVKLNG